MDRVLQSREYELDWLIKARLNRILVGIVNSMMPVLVSVVSFAVFVWRGGEMTAGVAFTVGIGALLISNTN